MIALLGNVKKKMQYMSYGERKKRNVSSLKIINNTTHRKFINNLEISQTLKGNPTSV